ncbi:MAG TPA: formyltransferase family protein [Thiolinea sp.]|nr:formyltransferase family protein [Thiolinea sp.]
MFCTYPSLYSDLVLATLLKAAQVELVGVVCSSRVLSPRCHPFTGSLRQLWRSGWHYAFYLWLITDGCRLLRRWWYRNDLQRELKRRSIPQWVTRDVNNAAGQAFVAGCGPDLILMAHFNQLLKEPLLSLPPLGCLNLHPSLLPDYRGVDPGFYALLDQCQHTGMTLHRVEDRFDSGAIIRQQLVTIRWHDSLLSLNVKLFHIGARMAVEVLQAVAAGRVDHALQARPQAAGGRYDSWPAPAQVRQFRRRRKFWFRKEFGVLVRQQPELTDPDRMADQPVSAGKAR